MIFLSQAKILCKTTPWKYQEIAWGVQLNKVEVKALDLWLFSLRQEHNSVYGYSALYDIQIQCYPTIITSLPPTESIKPTKAPTPAPTQFVKQTQLPTQAPTEPSFDNATIIDGTWLDDFAYDVNRVTGWTIYEADAYGVTDAYYYTPDPNPLVAGDKNQTYHGPFYKSVIGYTWVQRYFKCAAFSDVYVYYSFAYCETDYSDKIRVYMLNQTSDTNYASQAHQRSDIGNVVSDYTFLSQGKTLCNTTLSKATATPWKYKEKQAGVKVNDAPVTHQDVWLLSFRQTIDENDEFSVLYDVKVECRAVQITTQKPTQTPMQKSPSTTQPTSTPKPTKLVLTQQPTKGPELPSLDGITIISGATWLDDFEYDVNGVKGWNVYKSDAEPSSGKGTNYYTPDPNPLMKGDVNQTYHGLFYKSFEGYTYLQRYFKCATSSMVIANISFASCETDSSDTLSFYALNQTSQEWITQIFYQKLSDSLPSVTDDLFITS
eukprot:395983_1